MGDEDENDQNVSIGVTRYPCMPSLVALQQMRNRLHLAHLGKKLMKWTAMATGREQRRVASHLHEIYENYSEDMRNAYISLARSRYYYPQLNTMVTEAVGHKASITLTSTLKTVAGVKVMLYEVIQNEKDSYSHLGIEKGGQQIEETKRQWRELLLKLIKMQQERESFRMLEQANRAATKKMNVLSRIVIPRIKLSINYIIAELEEASREEFFRLKRVKQGKQNKNKTKDEKRRKCSKCSKYFDVKQPPGTKFVCPECCAAPEVKPKKVIVKARPPAKPPLPSRPALPVQKPSPVQSRLRTCEPARTTSPAKISSVRSSPLPSKVVPVTVPCKHQKSESAIDVGEMGYFENKYKEIVKITRKRNPDGTVSEEKRVITIRTEIKNPTTSRVANSGVCSSSFHGSNSSNYQKSTGKSSTSSNKLGSNPSCSLNSKTSSRYQPCSSCICHKEASTSNSGRRLPKKSSRISCRKISSDYYCCQRQESSIPNFFKTASMQGGYRDVPVQMPLEDKDSQCSCRNISIEFPTSTTELDETSCLTSKTSLKTLKSDIAISGESCYKPNDENIRVIKMIKKPSPCSICQSKNLSLDEDFLTKVIIDAIKKVYLSDRKSYICSRHRFCENCSVALKRIVSEVKKSVAISGSSISYSPFMYSSHSQESINEKCIKSTRSTPSCNSKTSVCIGQDNKLNKKSVDETKTSLLSEICCNLPKRRSTRSVCCDTRKSYNNLNYQRKSSLYSGKLSTTKNLKEIFNDGKRQIDASTCTKRSDRFDVRTGVKKSRQALERLKTCPCCKSDSTLMNESKSKGFLKSSKSL